jgi:hypothetical protein
MESSPKRKIQSAFIYAFIFYTNRNYAVKEWYFMSVSINLIR